MGYEIAEQLNWHLPDVIIYPTGGGTGLIGMWKAFAELEELGWIGSARPRMVSVQASGCAPIVKAFTENKSTAELWQNAETIASGLRVPQAVADFLMLQTIRESHGTAMSVRRRRDAGGNSAGWKSRRHFFCPEGAACVAALRRLVENSWIQPERRGAYFQHRKRPQIHRSHPPTFPTEFANEKLARQPFRIAPDCRELNMRQRHIMRKMDCIHRLAR